MNDDRPAFLDADADPATGADTDAPVAGGSRAVSGPKLGPIGWLRFLWRQLTSMRTALLLLLLVAVAAVPGSVFPQRSIDVGAVEEYLAANPRLGPVLDAVQMFDVYTSVWFSAAYLLLAVSLVGCIVPRTGQFWRALRAQPPAVPRRPERLGHSLVLDIPAAPAEVEQHLRTLLKRRRYRLRAADTGGSAATAAPAATAGGDVREVAAEGGHLREAGNILFHYGVLAVIITLALGYLVGWRGDRIVPVGESFANTRAAYHTFTGGPLVDDTALQPFVVHLDSMYVRFEDRVGTGQLGAPRDFRVETTIRDTPGATPRNATLEVNGPLKFDGAEVYLLGNGYAPVITVRDTAGQVLYSQATPFLPHDGNYRSTGAVKVSSAAPKQLGFAGVFLPTAVEVGADGTPSQAPGDDKGDMQSGFPDLMDPLLVLSVYEGNLFPDSAPQSVYSLKTTAMTPVNGTDGAPLRLDLKPGQRVDLPDGRGSIELERVERWAGVSTRYDPVKGWAMWSAILMLAGLLASLVIPRRRIFARVTSEADGTRSHVVLAGLAQREDAALGGMLSGLADDLTDALPGATIIDQTDSRTDRP